MVFRNAPRDSRRARFARWWRAYAGSIAFVLLILGLSLGFARIENARYEGCVSGNLLRGALREEQEENIAQTAALNRSKVFPQIDPAEYAKLVASARRRAVHRITVSYADRPCGIHIALPLTGTVVLPLGG